MVRQEPIAFIREQLEEAEPDLLRALLHEVADQVMSAEVDGLTGAAHDIRTPERTNRRNGYRGRRFDTRLGTLDLQIPKLRAGSYFPDWLLERRRRSERALIQVSELANSLDAEVASFRGRPLDGGPYRNVQADAPAIKVREGGRIVQAAALVATDVNADGHREILGLEVVTAEDGARRGGARAPGVARHGDGSAEPHAAPRPSAPGDLGGAPREHPGRPAVHRP